jgi:hypothetical protein
MRTDGADEVQDEAGGGRRPERRHGQPDEQPDPPESSTTPSLAIQASGARTLCAASLTDSWPAKLREAAKRVASAVSTVTAT